MIAKFFIQLGRVDELGSGVLNVSRLMKEYAGGAAPQFIEAAVFKMFLPIPKTDEKGLNEGLKSLLKAIQNNSGIQANKISVLLNNRPIKTIEGQIKALVEKGLIERRDSKKTGGYFIK